MRVGHIRAPSFGVNFTFQPFWNVLADALCTQPWFLLCKTGRYVEWHSIDNTDFG